MRCISSKNYSRFRRLTCRNWWQDVTNVKWRYRFTGGRYGSNETWVTIEAIHSHSPPFTSEKAKDKVIELTRILSERVGPIKLHIVPFTELQKQINKVVHPRYTMISTRRMMMRVSDALVHKIGANAIVNGENLGQVASQTLKSMYAINHVTSTPVLRPLLTLDKEDIIKKARDIGTYETSIQPFEDCCTIFTPKNPVTEPDFDKVEKYEGIQF